MAISQSRVLELALVGLESEKRRIEEELADIRERLSQAPNTGKPAVAPQSMLPMKRISTNKGKKMSAAQKRNISQTIKARWASRKSKKAA